MEIIRNDRESKVKFPFASTDEITSVVFERGGIDVVTAELSDITQTSEGIPEIEVPYSFLRYCGKFDVRVDFEVDSKSYTEVQQHTVIQPLFTTQELREFDSDFVNSSDAAIRRLERAVRAIIERITGQKFELSHGVETARSYNGQTLVMPKRIVTLEGSKGFILGVNSSVESDGWVVRALNPMYYSVDPYVNPIHDPYSSYSFREGSYRISGEWGYRSVPEQINLAALTLAQEYGCRESAWRAKYVETIKNVDWGVTYHENAFVGTGNVNVDKILESYILNKMVVL